MFVIAIVVSVYIGLYSGVDDVTDGVMTSLTDDDRQLCSDERSATL